MIYLLKHHLLSTEARMSPPAHNTKVSQHPGNNNLSPPRVRWESHQRLRTDSHLTQVSWLWNSFGATCFRSCANTGLGALFKAWLCFHISQKQFSRWFWPPASKQGIRWEWLFLEPRLNMQVGFIWDKKCSMAKPKGKVKGKLPCYFTHSFRFPQTPTDNSLVNVAAEAGLRWCDS